MRPLILAAVVALASALPAAADTPVAAFLAAWAGVDSYTATITVHETDGTSVQDRIYHYAYRKPSFAKIDIVAGPGRGGGAVWTGGDTVRGHLGGLISFVKLTIAKTDARAVSLRGDTIEKGSFQSVADACASLHPEPQPEATIDGAAVDVVAFALPPSTPLGATRSVVSFSRATHMPVRRVTFAGDTPVKQEDFSDVKLNAGLTEAYFN